MFQHPAHHLLQREQGGLDPESFRQRLQLPRHSVQRLGLLHELQGHTGCVNTIHWNAGGTRIISGSDDLQVLIWDPFVPLERAKRAAIKSGHDANIFSTHFVPFTVLSAEDLFQILATRTANVSTFWHKGGMTMPADLDRVVVCPALASGGEGKIIWPRGFLRPLFPSELRNAFQVSMTEALTANKVEEVSDLDMILPALPSDGPGHVVQSHLDGYVCVGDMTAISGAGDCKVHVHDVIKEEMIQAYVGHFDRVKAVIVAPDSPHLVWSGAEDGLVIQMDLREDSEVGQLLVDMEATEVKSLAINPLRPEVLAVGGSEAFVRVYDRRSLSTRQMPASRNGLEHVREMSRKNPDSPRGQVDLYGPGHIAEAMHSRRHVPQNRRELMASNTYVTFSADGQELLVNASTEHIYLYDLNRPRRCSAILHHPASSMPAGEAMEEEPEFQPRVERLKNRAGDEFRQGQFSQAIGLYNEALALQAHHVLLGNRAASLMKRSWRGDLYAALRDCRDSLARNPNYVKSHLRTIRCLLDLHQVELAKDYLVSFAEAFPDQLNSASFRKLKEELNKPDGLEPPKGSGGGGRTPDSTLQEIVDFSSRFVSHCNTTTDIKQANFCGPRGSQEVIAAGSDDGNIFFWDRHTTNVLHVLDADSSVVNCVQPHPFLPLVASSGIDNVIRIWSPRPEDGQTNARAIPDWNQVAKENQKRMEASPFESLFNWDWNRGLLGDSDDDEADEMGPRIQCRTS